MVVAAAGRAIVKTVLKKKAKARLRKRAIATAKKVALKKKSEATKKIVGAGLKKQYKKEVASKAASKQATSRAKAKLKVGLSKKGSLDKFKDLDKKVLIFEEDKDDSSLLDEKQLNEAGLVAFQKNKELGKVKTKQEFINKLTPELDNQFIKKRIFKKNLSVKNLNYSKIKEISTKLDKQVPLLKDLLKLSKNKHSLYIEIKPIFSIPLLKKLLKEKGKDDDENWKSTYY